MATLPAAIIAASVVATAGMVGMSMMNKPKMPDSPELPPAPDLASIERQKREDLLRAQQEKQGRQSTILTSPLGVTEEANVGKKTLLGD